MNSFKLNMKVRDSVFSSKNKTIVVQPTLREGKPDLQLKIGEEVVPLKGDELELLFGRRIEPEGTALWYTR